MVSVARTAAGFVAAVATLSVLATPAIAAENHAIHGSGAPSEDAREQQQEHRKTTTSLEATPPSMTESAFRSGVLRQRRKKASLGFEKASTSSSIATASEGFYEEEGAFFLKSLAELGSLGPPPVATPTTLPVETPTGGGSGPPPVAPPSSLPGTPVAAPTTTPATTPSGSSLPGTPVEAPTTTPATTPSGSSLPGTPVAAPPTMTPPTDENVAPAVAPALTPSIVASVPPIFEVAPAVSAVPGVPTSAPNGGGGVPSGSSPGGTTAVPSDPPNGRVPTMGERTLSPTVLYTAPPTKDTSGGVGSNNNKKSKLVASWALLLAGALVLGFGC